MAGPPCIAASMHGCALNYESTPALRCSGMLCTLTRGPQESAATSVTHLATGHVKSSGLPLRSDAIACAMKIVVTSAAPSAGFSAPVKYTVTQYMRDPRKPVRSGKPGALISEGPAIHTSGRLCGLLCAVVSAWHNRAGLFLPSQTSWLASQAQAPILNDGPWGLVLL